MCLSCRRYQMCEVSSLQHKIFRWCEVLKCPYCHRDSNLRWYTHRKLLHSLMLCKSRCPCCHPNGTTKHATQTACLCSPLFSNRNCNWCTLSTNKILIIKIIARPQNFDLSYLRSRWLKVSKYLCREIEWQNFANLKYVLSCDASIVQSIVQPMVMLMT